MNPSRRKHVLVFLVVAILAAVTIGFALAFVVDPPEGDDAPSAGVRVYSQGGLIEGMETVPSGTDLSPIPWIPADGSTNFSAFFSMPPAYPMELVVRDPVMTEVPIIIAACNFVEYVVVDESGPDVAISLYGRDLDSGDCMEFADVTIRLQEPLGDRELTAGRNGPRVPLADDPASAEFTYVPGKSTYPGSAPESTLTREGGPAGAVGEATEDANAVVYSPDGQWVLEDWEVDLAHRRGGAVEWEPASLLSTATVVPMLIYGAPCFDTGGGDPRHPVGAIEVIETGEQITITVIAPPEAGSAAADCPTPMAEIPLDEPIGDRIVQIGFGPDKEPEVIYGPRDDSASPRFDQKEIGRGSDEKRMERAATSFAIAAGWFPLYACENLTDDWFLDAFAKNRDRAVRKCRDLIARDLGPGRPDGVRTNAETKVIGPNEVAISLYVRKTGEALGAYTLEWRDTSWFFTGKHPTLQPTGWRVKG